jgi:hypothetical protein
MCSHPLARLYLGAVEERHHMPGLVCWHFYGDPVNYFTYPPEVNPFPTFKASYQHIPWKERVQQVSTKGRYFAPINSERIPLYRAYVQELEDSDPICRGFASALEDCLRGDNAVLPIGGLVDVNHWGVLQVWILQRSPFVEACDDAHLASHSGHRRRQFACPHRGQLVEVMADALFEYAFMCHTYAEMGPVKATTAQAVDLIEYVAYVFLTLRKRETVLSDPRLKGIHSPTVIKAYATLRSLVERLAPEDYAKMTPADLHTYKQSGLLSLVNHGEAIQLGFTPRPPEAIVGPMRIGKHLDWLSQFPMGAGWRDALKNQLLVALYNAFLRHGPRQYPKTACFEAIAEILYMAGLEDEDISADRLRKRFARLPL